MSGIGNIKDGNGVKIITGEGPGKDETVPDSSRGDTSGSHRVIGRELPFMPPSVEEIVRQAQRFSAEPVLRLSLDFDGGRHLFRINAALAVAAFAFNVPLRDIVTVFNAFEGSHSYESIMVLAILSIAKDIRPQILDREFTDLDSAEMIGENTQSIAFLIAGMRWGGLTLRKVQNIRDNFQDGHNSLSASLLTLASIITGKKPAALDRRYQKIDEIGFEGHGGKTHDLLSVAATVGEVTNEQTLRAYEAILSTGVPDAPAAVMTLASFTLPQFQLVPVLQNYAHLNLVPGSGLVLI